MLATIDKVLGVDIYNITIVGILDSQLADDTTYAIVVGMLEMAKYLEAEEAAYYTSCAGKLIKAMYDHCMVRDFDKSNGLMMHSTYCCNTPYNAMTRDGGKDECCSFGDYFFMEALTRLCQAWDLYW